jgi:hypothetical protein
MEKKRLAILILVAVLFIFFAMPKRNSGFSSSVMPVPPSGPVSGMSQNIGNPIMPSSDTSNNVVSCGSPASEMSDPMGSWELDGVSSAALIPREVVSTDDFGQYDPTAILSGQNYLDPRSQIGYPETLGGVLRNANRQYRSEPLNPRDPVSIFNLSTIPPDIMRPKFDISNDYQ